MKIRLMSLFKNHYPVSSYYVKSSLIKNHIHEFTNRRLLLIFADFSKPYPRMTDTERSFENKCDEAVSEDYLSQDFSTNNC